MSGPQQPQQEVKLPEGLEFLDDLLGRYAAKKYLMKPNRYVYEVESGRVRELFEEMLKAVEERGRSLYVSTIVGTDLIADNKFQLDYHVIVLPPGVDIVIRTFLPRDNPRIRTLVDLLPGVLAGECEAYDLLGIVFEGNPYLRRPFFAPPEFAEKGIHPLRKDVKL